MMTRWAVESSKHDGEAGLLAHPVTGGNLAFFHTFLHWRQLGAAAT